MDSLLVQLENNEAVLLMYLADELPPEDKAEVDALLATDANLRRTLDQIRVANAAVDGGFARLDALEPVPLTEAAAGRVALRSLRQWQLTRASRPIVAPAIQRAPVPRWVYATSVAACAGLVLLISWGLRPDNGLSKREWTSNPTVASTDENTDAQGAGADRPVEVPPLFAMADAPADNSNSLTDMKQQIDQLDEVASRSTSGERDVETVDVALLSNGAVSQ